MQSLAPRSQSIATLVAIFKLHDLTVEHWDHRQVRVTEVLLTKAVLHKLGFIEDQFLHTFTKDQCHLQFHETSNCLHLCL